MNPREIKKTKETEAKPLCAQDTIDEAKKAISAELAGGTESLKWLERWLAKWSITDCRSWIWWAAFGLSKRWALHNPIFLPKHWDTLSLERQRWKQCVCMCVCVFPLRRCWSLAPVRALGKLRNYCGWTMYEVAFARDKETKWRRDNVHKSWSALSLWRRGVVTATPRQSTHRHTRTSAFPCLSVKGLRGPSKWGGEIGQGPAGSLSSPLEDQGRLKLAGPLSLPCYPPSLPAWCIRTFQKPPWRSRAQPGGLERRAFYNDVRDLGGWRLKCMCMCVNWN